MLLYCMEVIVMNLTMLQILESLLLLGTVVFPVYYNVKVKIVD